jgi:molecular chaperone GrpE (heat shock protein)
MKMNETIAAIEAEITRVKKDNLRQKNEIEEMQLDHERQMDRLINDFIGVIDAFEKAETKVKEQGLDEDENAQKVLKRMNQPKKIALSVLSKYNVSRIDLDGKMMDENLCTVVDTEPDPNKEEGFILSIEKDGYVRGDRLIRRAEVIIVKN